MTKAALRFREICVLLSLLFGLLRSLLFRDIDCDGGCPIKILAVLICLFGPLLTNGRFKAHRFRVLQDNRCA